MVNVVANRALNSNSNICLTYDKVQTILDPDDPQFRCPCVYRPLSKVEETFYF